MIVWPVIAAAQDTQTGDRGMPGKSEPDPHDDTGNFAMTHPRAITIFQPRQLEVGAGAVTRVGSLASGHERILVIASHRTADQVGQLDLKGKVSVYGGVVGEPDGVMLEAALAAARQWAPDLVIGFGGGAVMDVAKLVAALWPGTQSLNDVVGPDKVAGRRTALVQIATTAGSGSEAGSRALIIDPVTGNKLAIESPHLMADMAVLDPELTFSLSPSLTAATGLDALAHCVEAFTSRRSHPMIDEYARMGIALIGRHLARAVRDGQDAEARLGMLLASFYGGICLGPVNTAAGHALAYPLGTHLGLPHGLANAVILPHVLAFNESAVTAKTQEVIDLLGLSGVVRASGTLNGLRDFCNSLGVEMRLSKLGATEGQLPGFAGIAHAIRRLMDNNPRDMDLGQIEAIYRDAF